MNRMSLANAIEKNDVAAVNALLKGGASTSEKLNGESLMVYACMYSNVDIVAALIDAGEDVNKPDEHFFWRPLTFAIKRNDSQRAALIDLLLSRGAVTVYKDASNTDGDDVAASLIFERDVAAVEVMLKHGAKFGAASVMFAASIDQFEMVKLLVANGGDVNYIDPDDGRCVLDMADGEIKEFLLAHGAKFPAKK